MQSAPLASRTRPKRGANFAIVARRGYITALLIVAMLSIVEFLVLANESADSPKQLRVVALAGRQASGVDRVVDLSRELVLAPARNDRSDFRRHLRTAAADLEHDIAMLADFHGNINPRGWPPPKIRSLALEAPYFLHARLSGFLQHANALAVAPEKLVNRLNRDYLYNVEMHEALVYSLNLTVDAYVEDAALRHRHLMIGEGVALVIVLGTLVGELLLIFRPMERKIDRHQAELLAQIAAAHDSERRLRLLLEQLPALVWTTDEQLRLTTIAGAGLNVLDFEPGTLIGMPAFDIFETADESGISPHRRAFSGEVTQGYRQQLRERWFHVHLEPQRNIDGRIVGVVGVALDVNDYEQTIVELQRSEEHRARAQRAAHVGSWERDLRTARDTWSDEFYRLLGLEPQSITPSESLIWKYVHPDDVQRIQVENTSARASGKSYALDARIIRSDGETRWIHHQGEFHYDSAGAPIRFIGIAHDITARKVAEAQLAHQANHDALTGLVNRTLLLDRLDGAIARAKRAHTRIAVLFIDLDNFKSINDTLGHPNGDRVLCAVADRLRHCTRESDTIARTGGDEFVVMLCDIDDVEDISRVVQALTASLSAACSIDDRDVYVTTSIGISFYDDDGITPEDVIAHADMAMYEAKAAGRNDFRFFTPAMHAHTAQRLELETEIRHAVEREELALVYQPIVSAATGRITGVEALLRWNHPTLGLIGPDTFMPVAEANGMIVPIGEWVLRTACAQAQAWHTTIWPDVHMSVNVSARQFRESLLETVEAVLNQTGFDPCALQLELTESAVMFDVTTAVKTMHALRALGIQIAIDDFGTGYSSMAYLKDMPVDTVKIDRCFVTDLPTDSGAVAIVKATTMLAGDLGLRIVAEGVETAQQAIFLASLRVDSFQGYLFSRPLAPATLIATFGHDMQRVAEYVTA